MSSFFAFIGFIVLLPTIIALSLLALAGGSALVAAVLKTLAAPFRKKKR